MEVVIKAVLAPPPHRSTDTDTRSDNDNLDLLLWHLPFNRGFLSLSTVEYIVKTEN